MGSERLAVMVEFPRKADGRRVFSVAFKRETVARITSGEKTVGAQWELLAAVARIDHESRPRFLSQSRPVDGHSVRTAI